MNMFRPVSCINLKEQNLDEFVDSDMAPSYNGPIVILENIEWTSLFLFFPVSKKNMDLINQVMSGARDIKSLSIYKTMIDSWKGSGNYLSGIVMDLTYDPTTSLLEQRVMVNFAICGNEGKLKSLVPVSFVDSIIVSLLLKQDVMVGNKLLNMMLPEVQDEPSDDWADEKNQPKSHPVPADDKNLKSIVKDILEGNLRDDKEEDPPENPDNTDNTDNK